MSSTKQPFLENHSSSSNKDEHNDGTELTTQKSSVLEIEINNDHLGSIPSMCIDKDSATPQLSDDEDDESAEAIIRSVSSFNKTQNALESTFKQKGITTKLHTACLFARAENVERILKEDRSKAALMMCIQNAAGETPLHCAIHSGSFAIVEMLVDFYETLVAAPAAAASSTSDQSSSNVHHWMPLNFKTSFRESQNAKGQTAVFKCCKSGKSEMLSLLMSIDCNPNTIDSEGFPAVGICAKFDHSDCLSILIEEGNVDTDARHAYTDYTALLVATKAKSLNCLRVLLGRDNLCNKNYQGSINKWSAVHLAAYNNDIEELKILLRGGVNPDLVTRDGDSALHTAAFNNAKEVCEVLVSVGRASRSKENSSKQTPYDVAEERGNMELLEILKPPGISFKRGCPCVVQ